MNLGRIAAGMGAFASLAALLAVWGPVRSSVELTLGPSGFGPSFALRAPCLFPWRTWPAELWARTSLRAAGITVATLYPLGFYLLVRAYEIGDGRYPHPLFNVGLAVVGLAAAFAAAARAQAAPTRRRFLGELIPGIGGLALTSIAIGTPLGLTAGS